MHCSYMALKNRKLHDQFHAQSSTSTSGKPIFTGVSIFVDGFTVPSSQVNPISIIPNCEATCSRIKKDQITFFRNCEATCSSMVEDLRIISQDIV